MTKEETASAGMTRGLGSCYLPEPVPAEAGMGTGWIPVCTGMTKKGSDGREQGMTEEKWDDGSGDDDFTYFFPLIPEIVPLIFRTFPSIFCLLPAVICFAEA